MVLAAVAAPRGRLTATEWFAVAYLALPTIIFLAGFCRLWLGPPLAAALIYVVYCLASEWTRPTRIPRYVLWTLPVAFAWTTAAGIVPLGGYLNGDWAKHFAVLNALVERPWPVVIDGQYLRYSVAYYLPAALAGKVGGLGILSWAIAAWTIAGLWLLFCMICERLDSSARQIAAVAVFMIFSGADVVGTIFTNYRQGPGNHFEWWARIGELPSNTTTLFWTPQHGLAAWLAAAILLRRDAANEPTVTAVIVATVLLWSPFVALGLLPFAAFLHFRDLRRAFTPSVLVAAVAAIVLASYLLTAPEGIVRQWIWQSPAFSPTNIFLLLTLECIAPALAITFAGCRHPFLAVSVATICALSVYMIGLRNDLLMRGSLPALAVMAILAGSVTWDRRALPLVVLLSWGSLTVMGEMSRVTAPAPAYDQSRFVSAGSGKFVAEVRSQYFSARRPKVMR